MPGRWCRLCLNNEKLINAFDSSLDYATQLRSLIKLCPSVNFKNNSSGRLSKYVCLKCSITAIRSFICGIHSMTIDNNQSNASANSQMYFSSSEDLDQTQPQQNGAVVQETVVSKKYPKFPAKDLKADDSENASATPVTASKRIRKSKRVVKRVVSGYESEEVIPPRKNRSCVPVDIKPEILQPDIQNNKTQFLRYLDLVSTADDDNTSTSSENIELESSPRSELVPVVGQTQPYCPYCQRKYSSEAYFKIHMEKHVQCIICKNVFASEKMLQKHWNKVCGRAVLANQPRVALEYVDQNAAIVEKYSEAFKAHAKAVRNEDDVIVLTSDDEDIVYMGSFFLKPKIEI